MKKLIITFISATLLLFSACEKETDSNDNTSSFVNKVTVGIGVNYNNLTIIEATVMDAFINPIWIRVETVDDQINKSIQITLQKLVTGDTYETLEEYIAGSPVNSSHIFIQSKNINTTGDFKITAKLIGTTPVTIGSVTFSKK